MPKGLHAPRRRLASLVCVALIAASASACGNAGPEDAVDRWLDAARRGEPAAMLALSVGKAHERLTRQAEGIRHLVGLEVSGMGERAASANAANAASASAMFDFSWSFVGDARIENDTAQVEVRLMRRRRTVSRTFVLRHTEQGWRIASYH